MRVSTRAAAIVCLAIVTCVSLSDVGTAAPRKWTDATGQFSIDADFVEVKNGEVHLKKTDGSVITVPVAKLSDADRSYVAIRAANKSTPAASTPAATTAPANPDDVNLEKLAAADGKISKAAWSKFAQAFRTFDVDSNDALDAAELTPAGYGDIVLRLADSNADGKVIRGEWSQLANSFTRLDKNRDGGVDKSELEAAAEATVAKASGTSTLAGAEKKVAAGPTVWRGRIENRGDRGEIEMTVNGNRIVARGSDQGGPMESFGAGTFTMTGDGKSGNMDAVYTEGRQQGQVCLGIYQMEGDTLRWCVSNRNGQRPQDFSTGQGNWLMVLQKVPNP
jgi:uncharacterized protein (TIGR03067 family)